MNKGYIVLEKGWHYNDEIYRQEEGYDAPSTIYMNIDLAKDIKRKAEHKAFRGCELSMYIGEDGIEYELASRKTFSDFQKFMEKLTNKPFSEDDLYDIRIPSTITDDELDELMKLVTIRFYDLKEVNIEGDINDFKLLGTL